MTKPRNRTTIFGAALSALLAGFAATAAEMPRATSSDEPVTFEDWELVCSATCDARTTLTGRDGSRIMTLRAKGGDTAEIVLETPLPLFLPDPVELTLGASDPRAIPWRTCGAPGCEARAPLTPELLDDLRRERTGAVALTLEDGSRVRLGVSLLGFTAAWRALGLSDAP